MDSEKWVPVAYFKRVVPSWDKILNDIEVSTSLNDESKVKGNTAAIIFRDLLGAHFFAENGQEHPLQNKWGNITEWQIAELYEWAIALEKLKTYESNYYYLVGKLKPREVCRNEGVYFLEIATSLIRVGFQVKFLQASTGGRTPDIEVYDPETTNKFYIEVSRLQNKDETDKNFEKFKIVSSACLHLAFELPLSVQILKQLSSEDIEIIVRKIGAMADLARANNTLELFSNEVIDVAIAHPSQFYKLEQWCKVNNRSRGVNGLSVDFNETPRITQRGRIHKKAKQIPAGETGILYMPVSFLYIFSMDKAGTFIELKETLLQYPDIKGIVLYCIMGQPFKNESIEIPGYQDIWYVNEINGKTYFYFYAVNENYQGSINKKAMDKFRHSLICRTPLA